MKIAVAFYFLSLFLFSTTLKATITVSGVAGVSYYDSNAKKIYGGSAKDYAPGQMKKHKKWHHRHKKHHKHEDRDKHEDRENKHGDRD